jgi:hypothetical protein
MDRIEREAGGWTRDRQRDARPRRPACRARRQLAPHRRPAEAAARAKPVTIELRAGTVGEPHLDTLNCCTALDNVVRTRCATPPRRAVDIDARLPPTAGRSRSSSATTAPAFRQGTAIAVRAVLPRRNAKGSSGTNRPRSPGRSSPHGGDRGGEPEGAGDRDHAAAAGPTAPDATAGARRGPDHRPQH